MAKKKNNLSAYWDSLSEISSKKSVTSKLTLKFFKQKSVMGLTVLTILVLSLSTFNLFSYFSQAPSGDVLAVQASQTKLKSQQAYEEEVEFWTDLAMKHPDYIDAWLALANLEYEKGKAEKAVSWINKAKSIDPNSDKIILFEQKFNLR